MSNGTRGLGAIVLDAGALVAVDRDDRSLIARLRVGRTHGAELRTSAIVIGQVWREPGGRQAQLAQLMHAVDIRPVDEELGRQAGILLGRAGTSDPIDATVVLIAEDGDHILSSDPDDIGRLAAVARKRVVIVRC